jgi:hypothetical protein
MEKYIELQATHVNLDIYRHKLRKFGGSGLAKAIPFIEARGDILKIRPPGIRNSHC